MGKSKPPAGEQPIGVVSLKTWGCRCRCGHFWVPREWLKELTDGGGVSPSPELMERPRVCPECKTPNWDRPKKFERSKKGG